MVDLSFNLLSIKLCSNFGSHWPSSATRVLRSSNLTLRALPDQPSYLMPDYKDGFARASASQAATANHDSRYFASFRPHMKANMRRNMISLPERQCRAYSPLWDTCDLYKVWMPDAETSVLTTSRRRARHVLACTDLICS